MNAVAEARHVPMPREGETLYRYGVPLGTATAGLEPSARSCPLTTICTCGRTIDLRSPDKAWEHRQW